MRAAILCCLLGGSLVLTAHGANFHVVGANPGSAPSAQSEPLRKSFAEIDLGPVYLGTNEHIMVNDKGQVLIPGENQSTLWEWGQTCNVPFEGVDINNEGRVLGPLNLAKTHWQSWKDGQVFEHSLPWVPTQEGSFGGVPWFIDDVARAYIWLDWTLFHDNGSIGGSKVFHGNRLVSESMSSQTYFPWIMTESGDMMWIHGINSSGDYFGNRVTYPDGLSTSIRSLNLSTETLAYLPIAMAADGTTLGMSGSSLVIHDTEVWTSPKPYPGLAESQWRIRSASFDGDRFLAGPGIGLQRVEDENGYRPDAYQKVLMPDGFIPTDMSDNGLIAGYREVNGQKQGVLLLKVDMVPDYNRDGIIDQADRGQFTDTTPMRWWLNDDDDMDAVSGNDEPGGGTADSSNAVVDTERDLVDFFPVFIDLKSLLDAVDVSTLTVKLKHAGDGLKFVYTDLLPENSKDYWRKSGLTTGYGSNFTDAPGEADTVAITSAGAELSVAFLNKMKNEDKGVILLEGAGGSASTEPLVLKVSNSNGVLFEYEMPLSLSPVDEMFRHVNLASHVGTSEVHADKTDEPSNNPDSLSNGKHFAFIHGYNVSQDAAQGWHAEVFKRMHQMGSKAKFIGVTWDGDTSPDYHNAVYRAFQTSAQVAGDLSSYSNLTIAAHSLGNMVVSNAMARHGFNPDRYYLLNAATPIEAYNAAQTGNSSNADMKEDMTESDWKDYPDRLFTSNWYNLFASGDARRGLTWKDRFQPILGKSYNFYSPGEDVVENATGNENVTSSFWNIFVNWVTGENVGTHAWVTQETAKGGKNLLVHVAFDELHGGWDFNGNQSDLEHVGILKSFPADTDSYRPRFASETSATVPTDEQLAQFGFFKRFNELGLYAPINDANAISGVTQTQAQASTVAGGHDTQWHLLAEAIPAMSFAAAANNIEGMQSNINMEGRTNGWPSSRSNTNWRHSDFKNISLNYVRPMYEDMLSIGGLDDE